LVGGCWRCWFGRCGPLFVSPRLPFEKSLGGGFGNCPGRGRLGSPRAGAGFAAGFVDPVAFGAMGAEAFVWAAACRGHGRLGSPPAGTGFAAVVVEPVALLGAIGAETLTAGVAVTGAIRAETFSVAFSTGFVVPVAFGANDAEAFTLGTVAFWAIGAAASFFGGLVVSLGSGSFVKGGHGPVRSLLSSVRCLYTPRPDSSHGPRYPQISSDSSGESVDHFRTALTVTILSWSPRHAKVYPSSIAVPETGVRNGPSFDNACIYSYSYCIRCLLFSS
jgi:hypothetical protein